MHTTPLHPYFGIEFHDIDLREVTAEMGYPEIRDAFERHSLLLFRNQHLTDQEQYAFARSLLTRLDYESAERAFREFLDGNAEHELAGNAQFWLGETYYVRQNFAEAAAAFIDGFQRYPGGVKAPDNLLKLGMSLAQLGQKQDACATLAELVGRFPDAEERIARRATQEIERLGC